MYEPVMSIQSDDLLEHLRFSVLDGFNLVTSIKEEFGLQ